MGRKNNKKKSGQPNNGNKDKKHNNNNEKTKIDAPLFIPSKELTASLESLSVKTTGTAEDHGLVGDCPYCLETLPPFWKEPYKDHKDLHIFYCCGKACCMRCYDNVLERACRSAKENFIQRHPQLYDGLTEDAFAETLSSNLVLFAKKADIDLCRICPFCRFPRHDTSGSKSSDRLKILLKKNAEKGHAWAQYVFAMNYLQLDNKDDEPRLSKPGIEMLHTAVLKGHTLATYTLSQLYYKERMGIKQSMEIGKRLKELAVKQGHAHAAFELHKILRDREEYAKSWEYAVLASDLGCGIASRHVAFVYGSSDDAQKYGVIGDPDLCLKYFKVAAELGEPIAQYYVAVHYQDQGDDEKMIKYLQMSADQDYTEAQFGLGKELFFIATEDEGGDIYTRQKHWTASLKWLRRARDGGVEEAGKLVKVLESDLVETCFHCFKKPDGTKVKTFNTCSKCKTVAYCCKECQKEDWKAGHKQFCLDYNK